ncbi:MAG: Bax inhibitor-1/YccA family protein [Nocardioidaceae bacterium]|nr:Bax inhibitor-1/YccA family protein [Nocardioidaceae bacterium]MCL2613138.1 Bax inhibitor-1/YccA family protein [Nocardioidaceae bacterium]
MQSNNPVFRRSKEFQAGNAYGNPTYAGNGAPYQGFGDAPQAAAGGQYANPTHTEYGATRAASGPMTIDSVVQTTGITLLVTILAAAITWGVLPKVDVAAGTIPQGLIAAAIIGSGLAFVLSMVNSFKRVISPALVLVFAAAEGVALGALSELFNAAYPGVVIQAVIGTFAAFAGTLATYKFMHIHVGKKFRTMVMAGMWAVIGLGVLEMVLSMFGTGLGLFGSGPIGILFAAVGLVLGVFMLVLDFDFVEQGVRNGLPRRESWRASFALLVSLVWIYTNLLRILAALQRS